MPRSKTTAGAGAGCGARHAGQIAKWSSRGSEQRTQARKTKRLSNPARGAGLGHRSTTLRATSALGGTKKSCRLFWVLSLAVRFPDVRRVVVLTGAGISVASGLRTYRGPRGLWTEEPGLAGELVAGIEPSALWGVARAWRSEVERAKPNAAHMALAMYQRELERAGGTCTVVTQNVDGLHERAGGGIVIALHGSLSRNRCSRSECTSEGRAALGDAAAPPPCHACGAPLRPDIVLFEEPLGALEEWSAKKALRDVELFVAIGTSGTVSPASNFVRAAKYAGAHTMLVNLDATGGSGFDEVVTGDAQVLVPKLFA